MSELLYIAAMLGVPFGYGVWFGLDIANRRPPSTDAVAGKKVRQLFADIQWQSKFISPNMRLTREGTISTDEGLFHVTVERIGA